MSAPASPSIDWKGDKMLFYAISIGQAFEWDFYNVSEELEGIFHKLLLTLN